MVGTLAVGEELAGAIIGLMLSGGNALEAAAGRRARRELTSLLERAPRTARRRQGDDWVEVPVDALVPGDRVIVRAGEVVPVDGTVTGADAVVDEAAMTGESLPVTVPPGADVRSGVSNAGEAFELIARRTRRRERLRLPRQARPHRRDRTGPVRPPRRPLRDRLPPGHPGPGRGRVAGERRSGAGGGRPRGRHAVPAHPRRADRPDLRALARRPPRDHRQGRHRDRDPGLRSHRPARQDGDAHARPARRERA